jgi:hypothetical protein
MFAEYLLLATGVGLLGRAIARLERQTRVLRHLNEFGRNLATMRDPEGIWRAGVEGAVRLAGAEGGFIAMQDGAIWRAAGVFDRGQWNERPVIWLMEKGLSSDVARPSDDGGSSRPLDAPIQIGAPVPVPGGGAPRQIVVFRAANGPFTAATADVLKLTALHVATALHLAAQTTPPALEDPTAKRARTH